jgi:preprotein translocase subunit YajC
LLFIISTMLVFILAQAARSGSSAIPQLLMMGALFVVFYFFMIRPQQKRQKDSKAYLESLKTGQEVVTVGGIHGKIISLEPLTMKLEVARGIIMTIDRSAISMESTTKAGKIEAKKEIAASV